MNNIPEVKLGIIAVSRDCFVISLSERRRSAIVSACAKNGLDLYECKTTVENELDMLKAVEEVKSAGCNALVVFLGNFGPETPETLIAKNFDGPVMYASAAEGDGDLINGRGDAYNRYIVKKEDSNSEDQDIPADANSRAKAKQYIKRYIKSCHAAIESIQLYSYSVTSFENETKYWIEYIDGVKKPHVEINALLGLNLSLDTETVSEVKDIVKLYNDYNGAKDSATLKTRLRLLNTTVEQRSSKIKMRLSHLGQPEDVSVYDCCLARVLHVYCSIMASLEKETTFVGFGNNSLGLSKDIETALFAFKRTGVLGAILLQDYPYGFYYNRTGEKSGRTYCSFICNNNSINYLVLVAFKMPNNSIVPDIGVSRSLAKIREKLSKFLTIPAQGGDVL